MEELEDEEDGVDPFSCYAADVQYTENADAEGYAAQRSLIAGMSAATSKGKQWENYETVFTNAKAGILVSLLRLHKANFMSPTFSPCH